MGAGDDVGAFAGRTGDRELVTDLVEGDFDDLDGDTFGLGERLRDRLEHGRAGVVCPDDEVGVATGGGRVLGRAGRGFGRLGGCVGGCGGFGGLGAGGVTGRGIVIAAACGAHQGGYGGEGDQAAWYAHVVSPSGVGVWATCRHGWLVWMLTLRKPARRSARFLRRFFIFLQRSRTVAVMRIRLRDVSALAGVSEATVSRVINGKDGVSDTTRDRVIRVLAELGYTPRALHHAPQAGVIGLVVPELDNPIFPKFVQAVEARLLTSGYLCLLCCASRVGATEDDYLDSLVDRRVSGVIVVSGRHADIRADHTIYDEITGRGIALVCINGSMEGSGVASVSTNDHAATVVAYRHLRSLGHDRIGLLIGPRCYTPVVRKVEGFRDAASEAGVTDIDDLIAETIFSLDGGFSGALRLLDAGVTGIVAASDMMALGAIRAARERGLARAGGRVGRRLRRHRADALHRPAADHRSAAGDSDRRSRRERPARPDPGSTLRSSRANAVGRVDRQGNDCTVPGVAGRPHRLSSPSHVGGRGAAALRHPGTTEETPDMATVELENINKVYENGYHAIHDLSLEIEDKEFLVLVGPSGCGKSTALRMIAGLETISGGTMRIGDRVVNDVEPKDRDIAMVFQNYALYPHMTVYDNIGFALKLAKVPKAEIDTRVRKAAAILELEDNLDRKPGQLSGGQRQRVAMGRAIVRQPAAFLMDEPLSNLDAKLRVQMRAEIASLQRELGRDDGLRHARPDRGDDDGGPGGGPEGRLPPAGRHPAEPVRPPGQRVRRRVHRFTVDEPVRSRPPPVR